MTSVFRIRLLNSNSGQTEIVKSIGESHANVYAEDLVIKLCQDCHIGPIARHLFALYDPINRVYLANNCELEAWSEAANFEFRLRFVPLHLAKLKEVDAAAFDYYFYQMRTEFQNGKYSNTNDMLEKILGLAVTDMLREKLENKISLDDALKNIDLSEYLPKHFKKTSFSLKSKLQEYVTNKKSKIQEALTTAWNNSNKDVQFVKLDYMDAFVKSLCPDYGIEKYHAVFDNHTNFHEVHVKCEPYERDGVAIKPFNGGKGDWTKICNINELCFISIQSLHRTVEISRQNGIPYCFIFNNDLIMKSFVSCLDGYYRLSEKWCFNVCKEITSPSLLRLRQLRCHGPVGLVFAYAKIRDRANKKSGSYLLRESMSNYNQYKLDVLVRVNADPVTLKLEQKDGKPSEFDQSRNLLLCKSDEHFISKKNESRSSSWCPIIPVECLELYGIIPGVSNSNFCVQRAKLRDENVVVKRAKEESQAPGFLKILSRWVNMKHDSIIQCKGVTLHSPLSLVMEHLPLGPLDIFLVDHLKYLKVVDLVESVTYLARALWYLNEQNFVHGHIRCHNLLVSRCTENSIKVKLGDPIGDIDRNKEAPWLAPESTWSSALDVWAFGTTVWEIFSYGGKPHGKDVFELAQPFACPTEVWEMVLECWNGSENCRKQPQSIVRDISQILYEVYNSRRAPTAYSVPYEKKQTKKSNLLSIFNGSTRSLSSRSISSYDSQSTMLTGTGSDSLLPSDISNPSTVDVEDMIGRQEVDTPEPFVIDVNQLNFGNSLGQGCYGEVVKAEMNAWAGLKKEVVAVKRIHQSISNSNDDTALRDLKREIEIMKNLNHENIVEIKGFVEDPQIMLVMEYAPLGSMYQYLKLNIDVPKKTLIKFALDIASGMSYLESKNIVRRDLASRNILVTSPDHVKISDFGLAQFTEDQYDKMKNQLRKLPVRWYSPESLRYGRFSHKSDVWGFGITLWEMYNPGATPTYFDPSGKELTDAELLNNLELGVRLHCPKQCPLKIYQLCQLCWRSDPHETNFYSNSYNN